MVYGGEMQWHLTHDPPPSQGTPIDVWISRAGGQLISGVYLGTPETATTTARAYWYNGDGLPIAVGDNSIWMLRSGPAVPQLPW